MKAETNNTKENGQDGKPHELNSFATHGVDGCNGDPIPWDKTSDRENEIAHTNVVQSNVR